MGPGISTRDPKVRHLLPSQSQLKYAKYLHALKLSSPPCVSKPDTQTWINAVHWSIKRKKEHSQALKVDGERVSLQHCHSTSTRKVDETLQHHAKPLFTASNSSDTGKATANDSKASKEPKDNIVSDAVAPSCCTKLLDNTQPVMICEISPPST